jgi:hypothetical protein
MSPRSLADVSCYCLFIIIANILIFILIWYDSNRYRDSIVEVVSATTSAGTGSLSDANMLLLLELEVNQSRRNKLESSTYKDMETFYSTPSPRYINHHVLKLPAFTEDGGDFIFGSIIERTFDQFGPHITTFFLSHYNLLAYQSLRAGVRSVDPAMRDKWKALPRIFRERELAEDITYEMTGKRVSQYDYICIISHSAIDPSYSIKGQFLPNRMSTDFASNRRFDILRCPMIGAANATRSFQSSDHEIQIEIQWNSQSLMKFTIPWRTRRTGHLLHSPTYASQQDAWQRTSNNSSTIWNPAVHLSMPLTRLQPSREHCAWMLEYVSHHLLIGFEHIYFTVTLSWDSEEMRQLLLLFRSYVMEGRLTILSSTDSSESGNPAVLGMEWDPAATKVFSSSMALFYAKGMADYLAVFDLDEFFLPQKYYRLIQDVIRATDIPPQRNQIVPGNGVMGSRGFSDKHKHPLCFLLVLSEIVGHKPSTANELWLGRRFAHAQEYVAHGANYDPYGPKPIPFMYPKPIYPTRRIYQAGVGTGSCCRLEWQWTICGNNSEPEQEFCEKGYGIPDRVCDFHRFDDVVGKKKLKTLDPKDVAIVLHFMLYHQQANTQASEKASERQNNYASQYYPAVMIDLYRRGLAFIVEG